MCLRIYVTRIALIAILLCLTACAATTPPPMEQPAIDLTGIWQGEIRVIPCPAMMTASETGRCNAVNRITFNLRQTDSSLTGDYRCAIGTLVCRDANTTESGTVVNGQVSGHDVTMRVVLPGDLSSCLYNGSGSGGAMRGGYRCYQGGGLVEVGVWQVSRGAVEPSPPPSPTE